MAQSGFKKILVIGNNHEEIIKKYSADTKVEKYVYMKRDDAEKNQRKYLKYLETLLNNKEIKLPEYQREVYQDLYMDIKEMDDFEYYLYATKGCTYDEDNGDALTDKNPNAHYQYEKCYQKSLLKYGEEGEGTFSNPFHLLDGSLSYSAKKEDIDWSVEHMYHTDIYEAAWDIVVNGREPQNKQEEIIKNNMSRKLNYFMNFKNKDEYVKHSCSFWCYGVATDKEYIEMDGTTEDKQWVANFYDRFIVPLPDDTLLTIYEAKSLN